MHSYSHKSKPQLWSQRSLWAVSVLCSTYSSTFLFLSPCSVFLFPAFFSVFCGFRFVLSSLSLSSFLCLLLCPREPARFRLSVCVCVAECAALLMHNSFISSTPVARVAARACLSATQLCFALSPSPSLSLPLVHRAVLLMACLHCGAHNSPAICL